MGDLENLNYSENNQLRSNVALAVSNTSNGTSVDLNLLTQHMIRFDTR